jgi:uncharacterized protein (DUF39 family)
MNGVNKRYGNNCGFVNKSYNSFYLLMDKVIVCYKCNYFGHNAGDCRYMNEDLPMPTTIWRRKDISNNEDFRIALTAEECKEEDGRYIDNGCSSHMTRDQDKFINLKRKGGNFAFGDDSSAKILEEGVVEIERKNVKAKNVLLVEDLNHNLLSVSKMCYQGYTLTFDSSEKITQEDWLQLQQEDRTRYTSWTERRERRQKSHKTVLRKKMSQRPKIRMKYY